MSSDNSTFKPAVMLMSGRAMGFAVTFFVPMLLARIYAPQDFGTYKQFFLITYALYTIGQFGLTECLYYFLPANPGGAGRYVLNSIVMLSAAGTVFAAILVLQAERIALWMSNPALAGYIPLIGPYLLFMLIGTLLETTMVIRKRYRIASATYAVSDVLRSLLLILPAVMTRSLEWLFIGGIVFCFMRAVATVVFLRKEFSGAIRFDRPLLGQQLGYALPFALYVLVDFAYANYHHFAVSYYFDAYTFAIYSVGCLQIPLVDFMATPAANVMMVRMGESLRDGRKNHLLSVWHDTTRKLALVFFPIVGLLVVNAYPLITWMYTDAYAASVPIFMIWSLSILAAPFLTDSALRVFAQTRYLLVINIVRFTFTALLISWFLSTFYLLGAVMVTMAGLVIAKAMAFVRLKNLFEVSLLRFLPWTNLGGIFVAAALACVPSMLLQRQLHLAPIYFLPVSGIAFMLVYAGLVWTCGLLTATERQTILEWISRPIRVLTARG